MPAILSDTEAVSSWLDPQVHGLDALKVLRPVDMNEVSSIINSFDFLGFLSLCPDHVISTGRQMMILVSNFEYLLLLHFFNCGQVRLCLPFLEHLHLCPNL